MPRPPSNRQLRGIRRNGWWLILHPCFQKPFLALQEAVAALKKSGEVGWETGSKPKLLKRILALILEEIPSDPGAPTFEQGNTLGADARGWRRAKFLGRFRLFFRFDSTSKVIVYAWVNDENTLRKAGSTTDPYAVFRGMLVGGDPPTNWPELLLACQTLDEETAAQLGPLETLPRPSHQPPTRSKKGRGRDRS